MADLKQDPYSFVLKQNKLPMSLLTDPVASAHNSLLTVEPFKETFGKDSRRKRPNLATTSMEELRQQAESKEESYDPAKDKDLVELQGDDIRDETRDGIFMKGQSKRIWGELYKVIDSSDIVVQVCFVLFAELVTIALSIMLIVQSLRPSGTGMGLLHCLLLDTFSFPDQTPKRAKLLAATFVARYSIAHGYIGCPQSLLQSTLDSVMK